MAAAAPGAFPSSRRALHVDLGDGDGNEPRRPFPAATGGGGPVLQPAPTLATAPAASTTGSVAGPTTLVATRPEGGEASSGPFLDEFGEPKSPMDILAEGAAEAVLLPDGSYYTRRDMLIEMAERRERQITEENNATIPDPIHPAVLIPDKYARIRKHQKLFRVDEHHGLVRRKDNFVALPPPKNHPWVENQPIGPHIVHGDGQQRVVGGSGEVGFDEGSAWAEYPTDWRGFRHYTTVGLTPTNQNGSVHQQTVIKHSLQLTGRGLFAAADIPKGTNVMVVSSTTVSLGFNSEIDRLCEMTRDVLLRAKDGTPDDRAYFHQWILTCQLSSVVERWPQEATEKVLEMIGGPQVLAELEIHAMHIARVAALIDMNSFLVESHYNERKGMGYWPEAAILNHSCVPNADYDIIPAHTFAESEYCPKTETEATGEFADMTPEQQQRAGVAGAPSAVIPGDEHLQFDPDCYTPFGSQRNYLFCCKTNRDIKAGEEILISYVPTGWRFEDRQYVLHDRYRFWCKCPKCAVRLDTNFKRVPRFMVSIVMFYFVIQLAVYRVRDQTHGKWEKIVADAEEEQKAWAAERSPYSTLLPGFNQTQEPKPAA